MLSIGIDVSKEKSAVCVMRPFGEVVVLPFEISHTESDLSELARMITRLDSDVKIVMEATGIYHLPVAIFLREKGLFISVINPYEMKLYRAQDLRMVKTDKRDSMTIANYGIDKWFNLRPFDYTMTGVKACFGGWSESSGMDKEKRIPVQRNKSSSNLQPRKRWYPYDFF